MEERIDIFFNNYIETIIIITESNFKGHKKSLIKQ
jgi:hypothetical protein